MLWSVTLLTFHTLVECLSEVLRKRRYFKFNGVVKVAIAVYTRFGSHHPCMVGVGRISLQCMAYGWLWTKLPGSNLTLLFFHLVDQPLMEWDWRWKEKRVEKTLSIKLLYSWWCLTICENMKLERYTVKWANCAIPDYLVQASNKKTQPLGITLWIENAESRVDSG